MIISRDVTFNENGIWDWTGKGKELYTMPVPINNNGELSSHSGVEEQQQDGVEESSPTAPQLR